MERGLRCAATASLLALVVLLLPTPGLAQVGLAPGAVLNGIDCDRIDLGECWVYEIWRTCSKEFALRPNRLHKEPKSPKQSASPGLDPGTTPRVRAELEGLKNSLAELNKQPTLASVLPLPARTRSVEPFVSELLDQLGRNTDHHTAIWARHSSESITGTWRGTEPVRPHGGW
ncbi:hypothetical protein V8C86DRAFT_2894050 [Haematococcus lacustris]